MASRVFYARLAYENPQIFACSMFKLPRKILFIFYSLSKH